MPGKSKLAVIGVAGALVASNLIHAGAALVPAQEGAKPPRRVKFTSAGTHCPFCDRPYKTEDGLDRHQIEKHPERRAEHI